MYIFYKRFNGTVAGSRRIVNKKGYYNNSKARKMTMNLIPVQPQNAFEKIYFKRPPCFKKKNYTSP